MADFSGSCLGLLRRVPPDRRPEMGQEESLFALSIVPCFFIMAASIIPAFLHEADFTPKILLWLVAGGICFALGTSLISLSVAQKVRLSLLTPFHYSQLIWAMLFGFFIFGNIPDGFTWIGCALIAASGIALVHTRQKTS